MARRKDETIDDYEERVEEMEKMRNLELREAQAEGRHYRPGMSFAEMNAQDNAERRANLDSEDRWRYRTLGGMMSPTERARQQELMFGVSDRERFVADNTYRNSELKTREREAKLKAQGMKDQGSEAARYNAEAVKRKAEIEAATGRYRTDADKEIAKINATAAEQRAQEEQRGRERIATITANGRIQQETTRAQGVVQRAEIAANSQEKIARERYAAAREAAGLKADATREAAISHLIGSAASSMSRQQIDRILKAYGY